MTPERSVTILRAESFGTADDFVAAFEMETELADFAVIVANIDQLDDGTLEPLACGTADSCGARLGRCYDEYRAQLAFGGPARSPLLRPHSDGPRVAAQIEDLEEMVPMLLQDLTRGEARMDGEVIRQLSKMAWPGNVAQLRTVLTEAVSRQRSGVISIEKLPEECRSLTGRKLTRLEALERDAIVRSLAENNGDKADAAEALGMSRATIYRKIKDFGST